MVGIDINIRKLIIVYRWRERIKLSNNTFCLLLVAVYIEDLTNKIASGKTFMHVMKDKLFAFLPGSACQLRVLAWKQVSRYTYASGITSHHTGCFIKIFGDCRIMVWIWRVRPFHQESHLRIKKISLSVGKLQKADFH